jgi:hypothetical protein
MFAIWGQTLSNIGLILLVNTWQSPILVNY